MVCQIAASLPPIASLTMIVRHLSPVKTKSATEIRLDVDVPQASRRESKSKESGDTSSTPISISERVEGNEIAALEELRKVKYMVIALTHAKGSI